MAALSTLMLISVLGDMVATALWPPSQGFLHDFLVNLLWNAPELIAVAAAPILLLSAPEVGYGYVIGWHMVFLLRSPIALLADPPPNTRQVDYPPLIGHGLVVALLVTFVVASVTALRRGYVLRRRPAVLWGGAGVLLVLAHLGARWLPNFRIPAASFGREQYVDCCLMFRYPDDDLASFDSVFEHGAASLALLIAALGLTTAAGRGVALAVSLTLAHDLSWTFLYADDQALPAYWAKLGCVVALLVFAVAWQRRQWRPRRRVDDLSADLR